MTCEHESYENTNSFWNEVLQSFTDCFIPQGVSKTFVWLVISLKKTKYLHKIKKKGMTCCTPKDL